MQIIRGQGITEKIKSISIINLNGCANTGKGNAVIITWQDGKITSYFHNENFDKEVKPC